MRPVFIGGCGRSGTTMLGSVLGAHSECIVTPESQFKVSCLRELSGEPDAMTGKRALDVVRNHPRFKHWDVPIDPIEGTRFAEDAESLLSWVVTEYARSRGKPEANVWIDHTGTNSMYAPRLLKHFPDARFIHLVRDGRAVAASVMALDWGPNSVHRAAHWWTERVCYGLASESYLKDRAARVSFEDIVTSPEKTLRELCNFLEIPYESRMLSADGLDVPEYTRAQHQLVGQPPDPSRVTRWKSQLSPRQVQIFESLTKDLLVALGYDLEYGDSAAPVGWRERVQAYGIEAIQGLVINRIRHRLRMQRSITESEQNGIPEMELVDRESHVL